MKKKVLPFFVLINGLLFSQYSSYYNVNTNSKVDVTANVNHNISGTLYENKTITTIDYGALKLANAQIEKNRLEKEKFSDQRQRQIALEIFEDPLKAYDYGELFYLATKEKKEWEKGRLKEYKEYSGFKEFRMEYIMPNSLLFNQLNSTHLQNVSSDGIKTDIYFYIPMYNKTKNINDIEAEFEKHVIGEEIEQFDEQKKIKKTLFHKKNLNRATVYGNKGYRTNLVWEDRYERCITDNYQFNNERLGNGYKILVKVRYNGNKDEVDFEKLEGRRYYLKPLIEKIIATATISELEIVK